MKISRKKKAIFEEWESALLDFYKFGDNTALDKFKIKYPNDFIYLRKMNMKRIAIKDTIEPLFIMGENVYWFTLTFNNTKDINSVEWKRKEAQRFLSTIAPLYLMVEEYGEHYTKRYHIHGFCVPYYSFTSDYEFLCAFNKWHSRTKLFRVKDTRYGLKKIKYISKYIVKDIPKIRRSKCMSKLYLFYKSIKRLKRSFPSLFYERLEEFYCSEITNYIIDEDFFYKLNCPF